MSITINYYDDNRTFLYEECKKTDSLNDFFNKTKEGKANINLRSKRDDDIYKSIYLKGRKLPLTDPIEKYIDDIQSNALFISNDPAKEIILNQDPFDIDKYKIQEKTKYYQKAIDKKTGQEVLIKFFKNSDFFLGNVVREIYIVHSLNLPGIVEILGYQFIGQKSFVVKESLKFGPVGAQVKEYLKTKGSENSQLTPTIRSKIIFGVACTMKHIHERNIYVNQCYINNVFLDDQFEPKISDLRFSKFISDDSSLVDIDDIRDLHFIILPEFGSEVFDPFKSDVYYFSFFIYDMFSDKSSILDKELSKFYKGKKPPRLQNIPDHYWNLINQCWESDPKKRPSFDEITEILKNDKFALSEFGKQTNLDELHEYQNRMEKKI